MICCAELGLSPGVRDNRITVSVSPPIAAHRRRRPPIQPLQLCVNEFDVIQIHSQQLAAKVAPHAARFNAHVPDRNPYRAQQLQSDSDLARSAPLLIILLLRFAG